MLYLKQPQWTSLNNLWRRHCTPTGGCGEQQPIVGKGPRAKACLNCIQCTLYNSNASSTAGCVPCLQGDTHAFTLTEAHRSHDRKDERTLTSAVTVTSNTTHTQHEQPLTATDTRTKPQHPKSWQHDAHQRVIDKSSIDVKCMHSSAQAYNTHQSMYVM